MQKQADKILNALIGAGLAGLPVAGVTGLFTGSKKKALGAGALAALAGGLGGYYTGSKKPAIAEETFNEEDAKTSLKGTKQMGGKISNLFKQIFNTWASKKDEDEYDPDED